MPAVIPGQPIAPGIPTAKSGYPQWGVGGGSPGSSAGWKTVKATSLAQKTSYASQGYLVWFTTAAAAASFLKTEENPIGSGEPQNITGLAQIGDFFGALTQGSTWLRVGEVLAGAFLMILGIAHMTGMSKVVEGITSKVPLPI